MSALPKEIRKKIRDADKAHKEVYGNPEADDKPPVVAEVTTPDGSEEAPVAAQAPNEGAPEGQEPPLAETQAAPPGEVATPNFEASAEPFEGGAEPSKVIEEDSQKWESRYKTIEGKYRKEIPRLHKQVRELTAELDSAHKILSSLDKQPATPSATTGAERLLKDEEIADYGTDLIDVVKRAAREEITPELELLRNENLTLRNSMADTAGSVAFNATEKVYDALDMQVPTWRDINNNSDYLTWLSEFDTYSGKTRQELLSDAFAAHDAGRVIRFFQGYLDENQVVRPESTPTPERQPAVNLADLAAPGAPRASAQRAPEGKRIWRQKEIAAFYNEVRKGKYRGKDDDKHRIEQDIMKAGPENRITA